MSYGKLILTGQLHLDAPTLIGSGNNDQSDIDVLLDADGLTPFIPATSLLGVLHHQIRLTGEYAKQVEEFWGDTDRQSAIRCKDLYPLAGKDAAIVVRDGIRIDHVTGMVADQAKYDYQVIERGAVFDVELEIDYADENRSFRWAMLATIRDQLANKKIRIGAKTGNGLGKVRLDSTHIYNVDFSNPDHVTAWLQHQKPAPETGFSSEPLPLIQPRQLKIEATFDLKHSLLVRTYPSLPQLPDAVNLKSGDINVLPGSSLKGAIRARAERILRTLWTSETQVNEVMTTLFGDANDTKAANKSRRGKVQVEETLLPKFISELHHRMKIDRFTGGTIEAALFDTAPVYPDFNEKVLEVQICVQDYAIKSYEDHEAGLLLLVLKDLWTGDLSLGGEKSIGRGVLNGRRARIFLKDEESPLTIEGSFDNIDNADKAILEALVQSLVDYGRANDRALDGIKEGNSYEPETVS